MNILMYKGIFQYNVVERFQEELITALRKKGHHIVMYDAQVDGSEEAFKKIILEHHIDTIIRFNAVGSTQEKYFVELVEKLGIINMIILVDQPFYHLERIRRNKSKNTIILSYDAGDLKIIEEYIDNELMMAKLYHAGTRANSQNIKKVYDVVVVGGMSRVNEKIDELEQMPDGILKTLFSNIYSRAKENYSLSLNYLLQDEMKRAGIGSATIKQNKEFLDVVSMLYCVVDKQIRNEIRYKSISALLEAGIEVHLFGKCDIEQFKEYPTLIYHGAVEYLQAIEEMSKSKIVLTDIKVYDEGSHERVLSAMLNKALVLSNQNVYCKEDFRDKEHIIYYNLNESKDIVDKVKFYLENDKARETIIENAYKVVSAKHTWEVRASELEALCEILRNEYIEKLPKAVQSFNSELLRLSLLKGEKQYQAIRTCLDHIEELISTKQEETVEAVKLSMVHTGISVLNGLIYSEELGGHDRYEKTIWSNYEEIKKWLKAVRHTLLVLSDYHLKVDKDFYRLICFIQGKDKAQLEAYMISRIKSIKQNNKSYYDNLEHYYNKYHYFWGRLQVDLEEYGVIKDRAFHLKEHLEDFIWLYKKLEDNRSKLVLCGILYNWVTFKLEYLNAIKEANLPDYYDPDIIKCDENEVFVDLGAYTGDSIKNYIEAYGVYRKIYAYEITPSVFTTLQKGLEGYGSIEYRHKAIGDANGTLRIHDIIDSDASINSVQNEGTEEIQMVTLDEDIKEQVTFIKMDIEGAEKSAIKGATRHLKENKPKLAVCTYHSNEDLWHIPKMIDEINPEYKLYMRYNGNTWWPSEYVLLAK